MSLNRSQSKLFTATPNSFPDSVFAFHFGVCLVAEEQIGTYGIQHSRIPRSSYRKLA